LFQKSKKETLYIAVMIMDEIRVCWMLLTTQWHLILIKWSMTLRRKKRKGKLRRQQSTPCIN
jgi:hypothetical protein